MLIDLRGPAVPVAVQTVVITAATAWRRAAVGVVALAGAANPLIYSGTSFDFVVTQIWAVLVVSYTVAAYERRVDIALAGALRSARRPGVGRERVRTRRHGDLRAGRHPRRARGGSTGFEALIVNCGAIATE